MMTVLYWFIWAMLMPIAMFFALAGATAMSSVVCVIADHRRFSEDIFETGIQLMQLWVVLGICATNLCVYGYATWWLFTS